MTNHDRIAQNPHHRSFPEKAFTPKFSRENYLKKKKKKNVRRNFHFSTWKSDKLTRYINSHEETFKEVKKKKKSSFSNQKTFQENNIQGNKQVRNQKKKQRNRYDIDIPHHHHHHDQQAVMEKNCEWIF